MLRSAPGRCVRATKTCHAIHLGKTRRRFPWSSGGGHRDLGPDPQQQQRLPRRGKLRLSTLQTLFCQQSAHAFTPQLSLAMISNFLKASTNQVTKLTRYRDDLLPQISFQYIMTYTEISNLLSEEEV